MWLSSKKYDELWEQRFKLQKEKDELIRILSGVVVAQGGKITIPMPSADSRTLRWQGTKDGQLTIESEIYDLKSGKANA